MALMSLINTDLFLIIAISIIYPTVAFFVLILEITHPYLNPVRYFIFKIKVSFPRGNSDNDMA